jgi:hypothetical protein
MLPGHEEKVIYVHFEGPDHLSGLFFIFAHKFDLNPTAMKRIFMIVISALIVTAVMAQDKKMSELKTSQLPKETTKWVTTNIPGGKIARAGKIEEKGVLTYVAVVESSGQKHAYLFDKDGKFSGKGDHLFSGKGQPAANTKGTSPQPSATPAVPKK